MRTNWIKSAMLAICVMMALPTVSLAKDNKEKKPFQWTWDKKLSGEKNVDEYLLSVDSIWDKMQNLAGMLETYTYKEDTISINGKYYLAAHMEDSKGNYVTRATVNWQFVESITLSFDIVTRATIVGLQTATATMSLPSLGMKALSYAKYVKAGPKILGLAGTGIKDIWTKRKQQASRWSGMKKSAVDMSTLGITLTDKQKETYNKSMYLIEINDASEDYTVVKEKLTNKSQEQLDKERDAFLAQLENANVLPSDASKSLDNLDENELSKFSM